jgi:dTDP-4-dehydrorhamnose 3,5-epimerase
MVKKNSLIKKKSKNGDVIKLINKKSNYYHGFGEVYISEIKHKKIKGWKKHTKMIMNLKVITGAVKFVFLTDNNKFKKIILNDKSLNILTVPKNTIFGFQGIKKINSIMNFANMKHTPGECLNIPLKNFDYNWN